MLAFLYRTSASVATVKDMGNFGLHQGAIKRKKVLGINLSNAVVAARNIIPIKYVSKYLQQLFMIKFLTIFDVVNLI